MAGKGKNINFKRIFETNNGLKIKLPLFIPVFKQDFAETSKKIWNGASKIEACMVNAFLIYKDRERKNLFENGLKLREYIGGFEGMICTDSGAFQGLKGSLYLNNKVIVKFQDKIQTDIAAPLDLITPPWDNKTTAEKKLLTTQKRTKEALEIVEYSILAGIQQGGRFLDLRQRSIRELVDMGVKYYGIGSLVPFFNKNHDIEYVGKIIMDARSAVGNQYPIHVYGAGDPLEIPFMVYFGANIFDSSSYGHFANSGYYMTYYGAVDKTKFEKLDSVGFKCGCPTCSKYSPENVILNTQYLILHNLWIIHDTIEKIRVALDMDTLEKMLSDILEKHSIIFPESKLLESWNKLID